MTVLALGVDPSGLPWLGRGWNLRGSDGISRFLQSWAGNERWGQVKVSQMLRHLPKQIYEEGKLNFQPAKNAEI